MNFGICPNCVNTLTEDSALVTAKSKIFKGNSHYLMCKNCQQVVLYSPDRDMIFDLADMKDDEEILEEINALLSEVDRHYEVPTCEHDCSACAGCDTQYRRTSNKERRTVQEPKVEPQPIQEEESDQEVVDAVLSNCFLAIHKEDIAQKRIITEDDFASMNIDEWMFFELTPVIINAVTTYEVIRH